jgi:hypothetical protein
MTQSTRQQGPGHEWCPGPPEDPADQPRAPGGECKDWPEASPPKLELPEPCDPHTDCRCETTPPPGTGPKCLEDLIAAQAAEIAAAEKAKTFKTDLEALLAKAKAAGQEYTLDKFKKLRKLWADQDAQIAELIRKVVCAVPCWRCVIECHVCPLLNEMQDAERQLYGDPSKYCDTAYNLYDMLNFLARDKEAKDRRFQRIRSVLAAWEKPAQTIDKILNDDAKLIADATKSLGTDAGVVKDVFLRLVPMHLAIAPPRVDKDESSKTAIDKKYTQFCGCDKGGDPDNCCGPNVGEWSLRQRLAAPLPYLVDPKSYFDLICCLVEKRYEPAKKALADAEARFAKVDNDIKRLKAVVDDGLKSFDKNAKAAIPSDVDCCDYEPKETEGGQSQAR